MSKLAKKISTVLLSLCACICLAFGVLFAGASKDTAVVSADVTGAFVIEPGAAARISENCGIRFTAYFDDAFYNEIVDGETIKSGYQLGMLIVPSYYYEDCDNYVYNTGYDGGYYEYFRDIKGKMIDLTFDYADIDDDSAYGYCVRGAIVNMKENNLDLEYSAIGYLKTTTANGDVYRYTGVSLPRSVRYVAAKAIEDNANGSATLNTLYGMEGMASYKVETYLQVETGEYILSGEKSLYTYAAVGTSVDYSTSAPEFDGYYLNASKGTLSGEVKADGSLTLQLYYTLAKGFIVDGSTNNPASPITADFDTVYGFERNSVKLSFNNHKYANFRLTALNGIAAAKDGFVTFYLKNETGVALEIYTSATLDALGAPAKLSATSAWQEVKLHVNNEGADTFTVCLRTMNESTTLNGESVYLSNVTTDQEVELNAPKSAMTITAAQEAWQTPAVCEVTDEMTYNGELTTKLGFTVGYSYARTIVSFEAGLDYFARQMDFYVYNDTGVALEMYTDPNEWSGVVGISADKGWQKVSLYAPLTAEGGSFIMYTRTQSGNAPHATDVKSLYISAVKCAEYKGTIADFTSQANVDGHASGWNYVSSVESTSEMQYNGQNVLKVNMNAPSYGSGVWLNKTPLNSLVNAIGTNDVLSVTVSFYYNASQVTGHANYIGISVGDAWSIALDKSAGWHKYSYTVTAMPANFILNVAYNNGASWASGSFSISGSLYVTNVEYTVNTDSGICADFTNNENVELNLGSAWTGIAGYESTSEMQYNGENTLKLSLNSSTYGAGIFVESGYLKGLIAQIGNNGYESVTVGFRYNASQVTGNASYIGISVGDAYDISLNKSAGWQDASFTITAMPANYILHVSATNGGSWVSGSFSISGVLYVSSLEYKLNKASAGESIADSGVYADFTTNAGVSAMVSQWNNTIPSSSYEMTFNGQKTLKLDCGIGSYGAGVWVDGTSLSKLVAMIGTNGVESVNLTFYYNATNIVGNANYITLGFDASNSVALDKSYGWHKYSVTLTSVPETYILNISKNPGCGWEGGTFRIDGVMYVSSIEYKLNYAGETDTEYMVENTLREENGMLMSFDSEKNIATNTGSWLGTVSYATDSTYGNVAMLASPVANWGGMGFQLGGNAKTYLNSLLNADSVSGVKISFQYKVEEGMSGVNYVGLFEGNTNAIATRGVWNSFEYVMTKPVENLILGVYANAAASWTGGAVNGTVYFTDVLYEIIYDSIVTTEKLTEENIVKVDISAGAKLGDFVVKSNNAMTTGALEISILNKTGRAFYIYTDATAWSGKVRIAVSNAWQTANLYVPNGATSVTVYVETVDGRTFNPTQTATFYVGEINVADIPTAATYVVDNGSTDYEIVYANGASKAEINAANTLQEIIEASTGVKMNVTNYSARNTDMNYIAVGNGFTETVSFGEMDGDAYRVTVQKKNNIYIYGVENSGTSYAILDFAEKYFGYVYTENEYTVSAVSSLAVADIEECVFVPTVSMRAYLGYDTMTAVYHGHMSKGINQELCYNTKQNTAFVEGVWETDYSWADYTGATKKFGYIDEKTHNTHNTLTRGVSAYNAKYGTSFNAADFYSTNSSSNGLDICFTKSVNGVSSVDFVALALMNLIESNYDKGVKYYVFEQEDYASTICVCNGCKQAASVLNGASGLNIWFINQVIDKIDSNGYADYDYKITTYAYFETKTAPTAVASYAGVNTSKTYSNVADDKIVIRFAFIGQDYHYGVYDSRVESKAMLDAWKPYIAGETMFWLYDTDFAYYPGYFPALNCIADNVYAAKLFNASAVYINGAYDAPHDWDQKLRRYVYSKMLWNFDEIAYLLGDTDGDGVNDYVKKVAMEYINSYYGKENGALVWEIIQAYESGSANKTVTAGGKSTYSLGKTFYQTQVNKIFNGNGSSTGVRYTTDEKRLLRLKEVMLSLVADLKYIGNTSYGTSISGLSDYFDTTNLKTIFLNLCEEVGFTQWSEDYDGDGSETVQNRA